MREEILESLKEAVIKFDTEGAEKWAKKALEKGVNPTKTADALT